MDSIFHSEAGLFLRQVNNSSITTSFVSTSNIQRTVASLNLSGSILSTLGSGFIILCYAIFSVKPHFRHRLIVNLAIADFVNALGNSIGGIYIISSGREIPEGPACVLGGFVAQLSVQATDFSILAIAIVTLHELKKKSLIENGMRRRVSRKREILTTGCIWILPFITAFIGLGLNLYQPVSGNWCWISPRPRYLRYVLTHMWRFAIILVVVAIYTYLHFHLKNHFRNLEKLESSSSSISSDDDQSRGKESGSFEYQWVYEIEEEELDQQSNHARRFNCISGCKPKALARKYHLNHHPYTRIQAETREPYQHKLTTTATATTMTNKKSKASIRAGKVNRIMLLRAYPIFYVLLWLPGIANRIAEAVGHRSSPALQLLQASTQFIGFANAVTYGWNERIAAKIRQKMGRR